MDDMISRRAAIDAICEDGTQRERQGQYSMTMVDRKYRDIEILEALPSAQPGWIPMTEKCPEIGQIVLCSLKTRHYYGRIHVCKYRAADKYYDHSYFDWDHNGFPDVVAWMPLPKPWEGDTDAH